MGFLNGSLANLIEVAFLVGVVLVSFLAGAVFAFRRSCAMLKQTIDTWSRSPIRDLMSNGENASIISGRSSSDTGEQWRQTDIDTIDAMADVPTGRSVGSSSSKNGERHTSTSSPRTESIRLDLLKRGMTSSSQEIRDTSEPERASKLSEVGEEAQQSTLQSTQRSGSRKNCRPCSWIRALVAGGVSRVTGKPWARPQKFPSRQSTHRRSKTSEISSKRRSKKRSGKEKPRSSATKRGGPSSGQATAGKKRSYRSHSND